MIIHGWGKYPLVDSRNLELNSAELWDDSFIARGNLRSYGDAALYKNTYSSLKDDFLISFSTDTGLLRCQSGALLADVIQVFLPRGWYPKITPGTKLITIGGAVAADVHGKNHHIDGCFSESVESFLLLQGPNQLVKCSRTENPELFKATCGGMGLTGIIIEVGFYLKRVNSRWINQSTVKTLNLHETFKAFEANKNAPYSVAWIDCFASGDNLGRSLLMTGDFDDDGDLDYTPKKVITIPFNLPTILLNKWSIKAFNEIYYRIAKTGTSSERVSVDDFFHPLDAITNWNKIYGRKGFVQLQIIFPLKDSFSGLTKVLKRIAESGLGSFLAVLKLYGEENDNFISFPLKGYSLALDFKTSPDAFCLIKDLTDMTINLGGRVYLAKDALMTHEQFSDSYPRAERFKSFRKELGLNEHFQSQQSLRLRI